MSLYIVVHLYSRFSMNPQDFPGGANVYQKVPFPAFWGAVSPHLKFGVVVRTWTLHHAKFGKIRLKEYPFGANLNK